jgi:tetratricopeptide (TPR) repeat protein
MLLLTLIAAASAYSISPRYADCVQFVEADLELGRIAAQQWVSEGGGSEARHCLAVADLKAGFPKLSALRLEEIAQRNDAGDDYVRARVLTQAAEAWLVAEERAYAEAALDEAFALVPDSGELQLTAAKVHAAYERWQEVVNAVNAAEESGFVSAETFVLRGRGRYVLGAYESAADDVVAALNVEPTNIDALVLRGDLAQVGIAIDVFFEPPRAQ